MKLKNLATDIDLTSFKRQIISKPFTPSLPSIFNKQIFDFLDEITLSSLYHVNKDFYNNPLLKNKFQRISNTEAHATEAPQNGKKSIIGKICEIGESFWKDWLDFYTRYPNIKPHFDTRL